MQEPKLAGPLLAVAAIAAMVLIDVTPVQAASDPVKTAVCASNPTAKICNENSGKN